MPIPTKLDHCVIHVTDWSRSNAFYRDVLGAELVDRGNGAWAYRFGTAATKKDLVDGITQLGAVGTTDATLKQNDLVILDDDKHLQNAENLVPIVNTKWLKDHEDAKKALDKLSGVLTTDDLASLIGKVDNDREKAADVAKAYLKDKGLI